MPSYLFLFTRFKAIIPIEYHLGFIEYWWPEIAISLPLNKHGNRKFQKAIFRDCNKVNIRVGSSILLAYAIGMLNLMEGYRLDFWSRPRDIKVLTFNAPESLGKFGSPN